MTELFPQAINVDDIPKGEYLHNWLYSVVPVSKNYPTYSDGRYLSDGYLQAYLTGYCKNCNNAFSEQIPTDAFGSYLQTHMDIPKTGCVPATRP